MIELHLGLVHHPVFNRQKSIVATTITHFDIHDIARVARSYDVKAYHLIHPSKEQLMFVERLKEHWLVGPGKEFNPLRTEAIKIIRTAESIKTLKESVGFDFVYATSAKKHSDFPLISFKDLKSIFNDKKEKTETKKILILFGTGSGLTDGAFKLCDALLEPIVGYEGSDFRHLSVRAAVAIVLDRLHCP